MGKDKETKDWDCRNAACVDKKSNPGWCKWCKHCGRHKGNWRLRDVPSATPSERTPAAKQAREQKGKGKGKGDQKKHDNVVAGYEQKLAALSAELDKLRKDSKGVQPMETDEPPNPDFARTKRTRRIAVVQQQLVILRADGEEEEPNKADIARLETELRDLNLQQHEARTPLEKVQRAGKELREARKTHDTLVEKKTKLGKQVDEITAQIAQADVDLQQWADKIRTCEAAHRTASAEQADAAGASTTTVPTAVQQAVTTLGADELGKFGISAEQCRNLVDLLLEKAKSPTTPTPVPKTDTAPAPPATDDTASAGIKRGGGSGGVAADAETPQRQDGAGLSSGSGGVRQESGRVEDFLDRLVGDDKFSPELIKYLQEDWQHFCRSEDPKKPRREGEPIPMFQHVFG